MLSDELKISQHPVFYFYINVKSFGSVIKSPLHVLHEKSVNMWGNCAYYLLFYHKVEALGLQRIVAMSGQLKAMLS